LIRTVADLLSKLRESESRVLERQGIRHAPTIGGMYEGLTKRLLGLALPHESVVDVSAGFITDDSGALSDEMDCLVVTAPGDPVSYTDKRKFHVDDVVAVIQVKKNLYSKDLKSGYENLASVRELEPVRGRYGALFKHAYQTTTRQPVPDPAEYEVLPHDLKMVYYTLGMELYYPARIVLGYDGFKTESSLRNSFAAFLTGSAGADGRAVGYGVHALPSLICCGTHSLVKANGMPFRSPIEPDGFWPVYLSTSTNPTELILEVIWTRLVYDGLLSGAVFDDADYPVPMNRFIDALPAAGGWQYAFADAPRRRIDEPKAERRWAPQVVDEAQAEMIVRLTQDDSVSLHDAEVVAYLAQHDYSPESMAASLQDLGLAAVKGGSLVSIASELAVAVLPDGTVVVGDSQSALARWLISE
jgi:hypothetical protein